MKIKNVYIIAGPNGSGKTTFAREFLPSYAHCPKFVNADLIAQGLSPFSPRGGCPGINRKKEKWADRDYRQRIISGNQRDMRRQ